MRFFSPLLLLLGALVLFWAAPTACSPTPTPPQDGSAPEAQTDASSPDTPGKRDAIPDNKGSQDSATKDSPPDATGASDAAPADKRASEPPKPPDKSSADEQSNADEPSFGKNALGACGCKKDEACLNMFGGPCQDPLPNGDCPPGTTGEGSPCCLSSENVCWKVPAACLAKPSCACFAKHGQHSNCGACSDPDATQNFFRCLLP